MIHRHKHKKRNEIWAQPSYHGTVAEVMVSSEQWEGWEHQPQTIKVG